MVGKNKYIVNESFVVKPKVSITIGCYLKCQKNAITVSETTGIITCIAHGSMYDAEVCPKDTKKYKFANNCLINR